MFGGPKQSVKPPTETDTPDLASLTLDSTDASTTTTTPQTTTTPARPASSAVAAEATALASPDNPYRFELLRLGVDRRLLLNRKKQLKMYRVWQQVRSLLCDLLRKLELTSAMTCA